MSWENSKSSDVLWGARKEVLTAKSVLGTMMDILDPSGEERDELYNYGHNYELNGENFTLLEMLNELDTKLGRANSAMREVEFRLSDMEREPEQ
jgi:hypothetical protein